MGTRLFSAFLFNGIGVFLHAIVCIVDPNTKNSIRKHGCSWREAFVLGNVCIERFWIHLLFLIFPVRVRRTVRTQGPLRRRRRMLRSSWRRPRYTTFLTIQATTNVCTAYTNALHWTLHVQPNKVMINKQLLLLNCKYNKLYKFFYIKLQRFVISSQ